MVLLYIVIQGPRFLLSWFMEGIPRTVSSWAQKKLNSSMSVREGYGPQVIPSSLFIFYCQEPRKLGRKGKTDFGAQLANLIIIIKTFLVSNRLTQFNLQVEHSQNSTFAGQESKGIDVPLHHIFISMNYNLPNLYNIVSRQ